jgi:hypothetical protein
MSKKHRSAKWDLRAKKRKASMSGRDGKRLLRAYCCHFFCLGTDGLTGDAFLQ